MGKKKAIFLAETADEMIGKVYDAASRAAMAELVDLLPGPINRANAAALGEQLAEVEVAFATWGIPILTEAEIRQFMPRLQIIFYGAGTVKHFASACFASGVRVVSAWAANAVPVAEYTVAQIILANKGYFAVARAGLSNDAAARARLAPYPGNYRAKVGLLGAGMIGSKVIELLRSYQLEIAVFDPFLPEEQARLLGVRKAELDDIFASCDVISNHLANVPETVGLLAGEHFRLMRPHAVFINTGRGQQVDEPGLTEAMAQCPTRTALLDVTHPEPLAADSPLLVLPNVWITPHIAGSMSGEVARMGAYMAEECARYVDGQPLKYEVTAGMLATMA